MTAWAIYTTATGELQRVVLNDPSDLGLDMTGLSVAELAEAPNQHSQRWNPQTLAFEAYTPAPRLTGLQILGLYTAAQHARARRMISAVYPAGHEYEGDLIDPDALVQRLVDATLALHEPISLDSAFHINGTALLRQLGVIESDAEAARILAGTPPAV